MIKMMGWGAHQVDGGPNNPIPLIYILLEFDVYITLS